MGKRKRIETVDRTSADLNTERIEALKDLFPESFTEGKVDFAKLREALGDLVDERPERYSFSWAGKRDAIRILQTPSRATLKPCRKESVDFDATKHLFIEGDNLEVLKLLYKSYAGRVKMIYIDPPYNTGKDFIYPDNFADPLDTYLRLTGQKDAEGNVLTSNPETSGRYHSAWLSMMYPRLFIARQLLREDGVIFVSIDDHEVHNLRMLMNEIFGEENFLATVAWEKRYTRSNNAKLFYSLKDSIVVYRRSETLAVLREKRTDKSNAIYKNPDGDPRGPWMTSSYVNPATKSERPNLVYPIKNPNTTEMIEHPTHAWKYEKAEHDQHVKSNRLWWGRNGNAKYPRLKIFLENAEGAGLVPVDLWHYKSTGTTDDGGQAVKSLFSGQEVFDNPKPPSLIARMIDLACQGEDDIVVDFFAGSSSTAEAVLASNRADETSYRFVLVQLPEQTERGTTAQSQGYSTIAEVGKERIRRVIAKMKSEREGELELKTRETPEDLGFRVFKLDESHFRRWTGTEEKDPAELAEQMELFTDPLLPGWKPEDVLWEIILKEGLSLTSRIEPAGPAGPVAAAKPHRDAKTAPNTVWHITDDDKNQTLLICLDDKLNPETARSLNLAKDTRFICRDAALTDKLAANLALQCRLKTI